MNFTPVPHSLHLGCYLKKAVTSVAALSSSFESLLKPPQQLSLYESLDVMRDADSTWVDLIRENESSRFVLVGVHEIIECDGMRVCDSSTFRQFELTQWVKLNEFLEAFDRSLQGLSSLAISIITMPSRELNRLPDRNKDVLSRVVSDAHLIVRERLIERAKFFKKTEKQHIQLFCGEYDVLKQCVNWGANFNTQSRAQQFCFANK